MCTGSGEASRAGSGPLWIWQLGGFAADPPTGSGSTSQLIMRTYPDARLRADPRGRDGGVREELAAGVIRPAYSLTHRSRVQAALMFQTEIVTGEVLRKRR